MTSTSRPPRQGVIIPANVPRYVVVWRFFAGHHLDGKHRGDSTFLRSATRSLEPHGHLSRWARMPGWRRAAWRVGSCLAAVLLVLGWTHARTLTVVLFAITAAAVLTLAGWRAVRAFRLRRHRRRYVLPLAATLAPQLGISHGRPEKWLTVPIGHDTRDDAEVRIYLPEKFVSSKESRDLVTGIVTSKLGLVDVDAEYRMIGSPVAVFKRAPRPPAMVPFDQVRAEVEACEPGEIVIGLDRRHNIFRGSFNVADPHWGCSVGSNRGKSTFLQLVAAQILHQDPAATVTGIDPKMVSLEPLVGIPGVTMANDPRNVPAMWEAIARFRAEMDRRMDLLAADPTATFPFALLVLDEVNQFAAQTAAIWREVKEKGDPATAPVWMDVAAILWQGRQLRCHAIMVGQRLDDRATGGIGLRDSLGFRALGGFTPQQWMILVGTTPIPRSQKPRGRWIYSDGESLTWVQNAYATPEEVRDYALVGRRPGVSQIDLQKGPPRAEKAPSATGAGSLWVVGLDAGAEVLGLSTDAFRKRRERAGGKLPGETRRGGRPAWTVADLRAWAQEGARA